MNRRICKVLIVLISLIVVISVVSAQGGRGGRGQPNNLEFDDSVIQVVLDISEYTTFGNALSDQIDAGDGAGIDNTFRNSGVVIDEENGLYYGDN